MTSLRHDGNGEIRIEGELTLHSVPQLEIDLRDSLALEGVRVSVDLDGVTGLDTAGAIFVRRIPDIARAVGIVLTVGPLPLHLQAFFDYVGDVPDAPVAEKEPSTPLERLGGWMLEAWDGLFIFLYVLSDLTWDAIAALPKREGIRRGSFVDQAAFVGSQGLPIVAVIMFLIGAVSTLQTITQLRQFGANVLVADILAIGITRELGPLMTAIIVAGRSGSAIAAEISTMKFTEEIDALRTMALDPLRLVAVPKMWAMILTVPLLTVMADFMGLLGGTLTGVLSMEISLTTWTTRITDALMLKDVLTGLLKSISFAWIITAIAVDRGLQHRGGASGVGQATTASVVASIFGIIVLDLTWNLIFYLR